MLLFFSLIFEIAPAKLFPDGFKKGNEPFERIPKAGVAKLLTEGVSPGSPFKSYLIVDARSKLEYAGGHIRGAINSEHPQENVEKLYGERYDPNTLFIFHCEFSQFRGPSSAWYFIQIHRRSHSEQPLFIVVMDGGYSQFYAVYPHLCDGDYWPEKRLDPGNPANWEFLNHAREIVPELFG
jgi:M-phase inducer tyrosine phosphatase